MQYSDVTTQLTAEWNTGNIELPDFFDKNVIYNLKYPHRLFIQVYEEMPIEEISKDDVFKRKQMGVIHGVYDSYADCELALKETTRSITSKSGWRLGGKSKIIKKRKAFVFILGWFALEYLRSGEW